MSDEAVFHLKFNDATPEQIYTFLKELDRGSELDIKVGGLDKLEEKLRETAVPMEKIQSLFEAYKETRKQILAYFDVRRFDWPLDFCDEAWGLTPDGSKLFWGGDLDNPPDPEEGPYVQQTNAVNRGMDFTLVEVNNRSCGGDPSGMILNNGMEV